jgi:hypothetical protein
MESHADNPAKGWLLFVLCVIALSVFAVQCAHTWGSAAVCVSIQVVSDELTSAEAETYCRYAVQERQKVEAFWGATWSEPIRIHVSRAYRISRALVPGALGNRGFLEMPLHRVRENTGGLLHDIVHIYAPNTNRFLAEGLAVYLHAKLAGNPAFPNFGDDLRRLAVRGLSGVESLDALNRVQTPHPLGTVMEEKTAYILAGSFVGFVIERYGLASFRSVYEAGSYEQVYGKSLGMLEREWRVNLQEN